nr:MAG TPA: Late embryogenesis abundant protein [Bacteriophage sp.]
MSTGYYRPRHFLGPNATARGPFFPCQQSVKRVHYLI